MASYLESAIGHLIYNLRGRDAKLFTKAPTFAAPFDPTVTVYSPDYGQTPVTATTSTPPTPMRPQHTQVGENHFPSLAWTVPRELNEQVESWMVIVEDPDAPLPSPIVHGLYYGFAASKTSITNADIEAVGSPHEAGKKAEFCYSRNRHRTVWAGPRPIRGHGSHRYFFQVVGVRGVDFGENRFGEAGGLTKEVLAEKVRGKVVAWGLWIGTFERL